MGQQKNRFVLVFILFVVPMVLHSQEYLRTTYSTDDGLVSSTIHDSAPPLLELLHLDASGMKFPLNRDITLEYHQNDLTFYFRGISVIDEKAIRYNLKLEGFDREWVRGFQTPNNQYRYTNVAPGKYRFYIQAVNSLGEKSGILSSGTITVKNPFSQTAWFYILVFFLVLFIIFFIANFISKRRLASRLEEEVRQRTRELEASEKY
ncbi:MAG: hypothetical protein GTO45_34410, partial [Candidatus Aminicenantes bacterium]|nr:hypothetical protein [Candidatus Aminicenantes bacterium]NIM83802.1 hypothetical protein [Candidatus Aminicenantes bacterium]NIN23252.1 hypothetical protein [Candidatus Aminicenantes bacterium]NIN46956.1 hypothetical protein [Candidatus Aminicenantes bacterium]NIN89878.1 hypothetical protein [Candidatus Aminicenantes bacterium]